MFHWRINTPFILALSILSTILFVNKFFFTSGGPQFFDYKFSYLYAILIVAPFLEEVATKEFFLKKILNKGVNVYFSFFCSVFLFLFIHIQEGVTILHLIGWFFLSSILTVLYIKNRKLK